MKKAILSVAIAATLGLAASAAMADTLDDVKARGFLLCGLSEGTAGLETPAANHEWVGIDVAY